MSPTSIHELVADASKLLGLCVDELYVTLGSQLLVYENPSKVAGIVCYLGAIRTTSESRVLFPALGSIPETGDSGKGLSAIWRALRHDGQQYIARWAHELCKAFDNEDILRLADELSTQRLQILVMVIASILKLPREMDTIAATVAVLLAKLGLRDFCRQHKNTKISE
jgi:hypothetical protein